jgi:hypothetical protein
VGFLRERGGISIVVYPAMIMNTAMMKTAMIKSGSNLVYNTDILVYGYHNNIDHHHSFIHSFVVCITHTFTRGEDLREKRREKTVSSQNNTH